MKKALFLLICLVCLFVIQGLVRSIITLWEKREVYVSKQEELVRVKKEHASLKEQEKKVNDPLFAEKEIRNKLFLVKPNEKIVLLPTGILEREAKSHEKKIQEKPVYEQWLTLFLNGKLD